MAEFQAIVGIPKTDILEDCLVYSPPEYQI